MIVQMDGVEDAAITRVCRALEPLCEKLDDARRLRSAGGSADAADGASDGVGLPAERLEVRGARGSGAPGARAGGRAGGRRARRAGMRSAYDGEGATRPESPQDI